MRGAYGRFGVLCCILCLTGLFGCGWQEEADAETVTASASVPADEASEEDDEEAAETPLEEPKMPEKEQDGGVLEFVDVYGEQYRVQIEPQVKKHPYHLSAFVRKGDRLSYVGDASYESRIGVDVSYFQGEIDWEKVKNDGISFAFLRVGYRGYEKGGLRADPKFADYREEAAEAGLDVGVYFFSQAVNEAEAREEAEFVLDALQGCKLQLPVVYDPEHIVGREARTDALSREQLTANALCFCETIREAGYEPMVYCNMLWEAYELELDRLADYRIWYADYEALPQTPYHFSFWQYSNTGTVDGIQGNVDMDIEMIPTDGL